jgi:hypothetical protein
VSNPIVQLPMGDLWRAPTYDADGNIEPRKDNVDSRNMVARRVNSPDAQAILMADYERLKAEAEAIKAK